MIQFASGLRLIPVVLFATASLLALKTASIVSGSGYIAGPQRAYATAALSDDRHHPPTPSAAQHPKAVKLAEVKYPEKPAGTRSWAQEMLGYPDITGSVSKPATPPPPAPAAEGGTPADKAATRGDKETAKPSGAASATTPETPAGAAKGPAAADAKPNAFTSDKPIASAGERTLLEQLQHRRQELDARDRELEIREGLLKTAEQRIEARLSELKEVEAKVDAAAAKKDEAEAARLKGLVTMYENMKPKDAAKIFDRLDMRVLIDVATQINPRRMSDILAAMSTEAAERLTVELATRASDGRSPSAADLPKIEGRPRS
ncbi:MAG: flagellar protein FlbB [Rhizobiales bacterium]|nr:flagellar protein FlbB [Hyphomicrobiales bacterium]